MSTLPKWLTKQVYEVALGIWENPTIADLRIMGDLLEQSGCPLDNRTLEHCRLDNPYCCRFSDICGYLRELIIMYEDHTTTYETHFTTGTYQ